MLKHSSELDIKACSSDEQLDYLITHEGLYKFGFDYCDANLDQECLMKDHIAYIT